MHEGSLVKQLLLHDSFKTKSKKAQLISQLLLLGNMYCASSSGLKAQKFFELAQENLDSQISENDKELALLFKKMLEICYTIMINLYNTNKKEGDTLIPVEWLAAEDKLEDIYDTIYEEF